MILFQRFPPLTREIGFVVDSLDSTTTESSAVQLTLVFIAPPTTPLVVLIANIILVSLYYTILLTFHFVSHAAHRGLYCVAYFSESLIIL